MKESFILILLTGLLNLVSNSQTQPTSNRPAQNEELKTAARTLTFDCPGTVQIGFKSISPGWKEGFGGGNGMTVSFNGAMVSGTPQVLTCVYMQQNSSIPFSLVQQAPTGYTCAVEQSTNNEKLNRRFVCRPIPTPPKIVPKSN